MKITPKSNASGNPTIQRLSWSISRADIDASTVTGSIQTGVYYLITGATSVTAIEFGVVDAGGFIQGQNLTYANWYYKIDSAPTWTQFTGLSTGKGDINNIDLFDALDPMVSKTVDIGILPDASNAGFLDGNQYFGLYVEWS